MKTNIFTLDEIKKTLSGLNLIPIIEQGFAAYSAGQAVVPPIGELLLDKGEVHIKYGYLQQDEYYVIKVASAFYDNPALNLPSSNGLMLLYSQQTGQLVSILLDEGYLTDTRTAVAGAIAAKHLAPSQVVRIGIVGTGTQARLQLLHLKQVTDCRDVLVWGRGEPQLLRYKKEMEEHGFRIQITTTASDILNSCNLIVTTTPAHEPLLFLDDVRAGVHITAIGSDTPHKQELDPALMEQADLIVADSISQCLHRGEIYQAIKSNHLFEDDLIELGNIIAGKTPGRTSDKQITVADLTGVAVQDIKIAEAVYKGLISKNS